MRVKLDYGTEGLWAEIPDENLEAVLGLSHAPPVEDADAAVRAALANPHGSPPLAELARGKQSACVVISDITRPVPNPVLLPPILETLEAAGIPRSGIVILNATGTHRPNTPEELRRMVGDHIFENYRIENHIAEDLESHGFLGETPRGVPMWVDHHFLNAELRLSSALIEPHFMAGFSGGRKNICPGICAMETVRVWHGPRFIGHERSDAGSVIGNPVHEDSLHTARAAGLHFICDVTLDEERRITGIYAGEPDAAWTAGVRSVEKVVQSPVRGPLDIVVTTTAGYPLDLTFYQVVKGMVGALPVLKEGGTILIVGRCAEGVGNRTFADTLLEIPDGLENLTAFVEKTYDPAFFIPDQWEIHELWKAVRRAEVLVFTEGIDPETLARCFVTPISSVEEGIRRSLERHGADARIAVIPKGPYVIPVLEAS